MYPEDEKILGECLKAAIYSNFFPEWEFHAIFGLSRDEVKEVYEDWPNVDFASENVQLSIHNTINNLTGYPISDLTEWDQFISISREELTRKFPQYRGII